MSTSEYFKFDPDWESYASKNGFPIPLNEQPPPEIINDAEEHEVESILDFRWRGRGYQFLIKWKGYSTSENTWEPERNLTNASELLLKFKRDNGIPTRAVKFHVSPPILPAGSWDEYLKRFVHKQERMPYHRRHLFNPLTGVFERIHGHDLDEKRKPDLFLADEDVSLKGGVMLRC